MESISPDQARQIVAMLDRRDRLNEALNSLSQQGVTCICFEKPAMVVKGGSVSPSWGEVTGPRVAELVKLFTAERDAATKALNDLGVAP